MNRLPSLGSFGKALGFLLLFAVSLIFIRGIGGVWFEALQAIGLGGRVGLAAFLVVTIGVIPVLTFSILHHVLFGKALPLWGFLPNRESWGEGIFMWAMAWVVMGVGWLISFAARFIEGMIGCILPCASVAPDMRSPIVWDEVSDFEALSIGLGSLLIAAYAYHWRGIAVNWLKSKFSNKKGDH